MIFDVFRSGWLQLKSDRAALALSFVVPVVFFTIFAAVFAGSGRDETRRIRLAVVDQDGSASSRRLVAALEDETTLDAITEWRDHEDAPARKIDAALAEALVRDGELAVALVIPKGFGKGRVRFGPGNQEEPERIPSVRLLADTSDPVGPKVVEGMIQKVVMTSLPEVMMRAGVDLIDKYSGGYTPDQRTRLEKSLFMLGGQMDRTTTAGENAPLRAARLVNVKVEDLLGASKRSPLVAFYAAAIGVMFMMFTASNAAGVLLEESESGTLDRILSTRVTMGTLLLGKLAWFTVTGFLQLTVMFVWGMIGFELELIPHLGGFVIMAMSTSLACAAFGLVIAATCRSRAQLAAVSTLVILSISAIGGSMFPRFLMPEAVLKMSLVVFNSWALDGFIKVFWREQPSTELWPEVAVLLAWAVVLFAIARTLARRWERV